MQSINAAAQDTLHPLLPAQESPPAKDVVARSLSLRVYRVLAGRSRTLIAVVFNWLRAALIVICVAAFVVESIPSVGADNSPYAPYFYGLEAASSSMFTLEYIAYVWTIPESGAYQRKYGAHRRWLSRFWYVLSLRALIDLASCSPFFIELAIGRDLPTFTWIRAFRLLRILKSEKSGRALRSVYRVVWYTSDILIVALFLGLLLMMATSTLLYYAKPLDDTVDDFSSIPATFYLSILMLTGQGTPSGDLPWYTKIIVMLTAVFSVPIFVIPSSMLTWGFEAEAERLMRKKRVLRKKKKAAQESGQPLLPESSSASSTEVDSQKEWDEYEEVVLGDDDDDDDDVRPAAPTLAASATERTQSELMLLREVAVLFEPAGSPGGTRPIDELRQWHAARSLSDRRATQWKHAARSKVRAVSPSESDGRDWDADVEDCAAGSEAESSDLCHRLARIEAKLDSLSTAVATLDSARLRASERTELHGD